MNVRTKIPIASPIVNINTSAMPCTGNLKIKLAHRSLGVGGQNAKKMENLLIPAPRMGQKIRVVRLLKGYSQEYIAMRLGISQNAYSKIERGRIRIKPVRLKAISDILGTPPYALARVNDLIAGPNVQSNSKTVTWVMTKALGDGPHKR